MEGGPAFSRHAEVLDAFRDWRLPVCEEIDIVSGVAGCNDYYSRIAVKRPDLPYEIDGVVFKVNVLADQETLEDELEEPDDESLRLRSVLSLKDEDPPRLVRARGRRSGRGVGDLGRVGCGDLDGGLIHAKGPGRDLRDFLEQSL